MIFMEDTAIETDIPKIGTVKFAVYHEDTAVPHFHVFNKQTQTRKGKRINTCFEFNVGKYFRHGIHDTILNNQQLTKLQRVLEEPVSTKEDPDGSESLWSTLKDIWDRSAEDKNKVTAEEIPDYTNANNMNTNNV